MLCKSFPGRNIARLQCWQQPGGCWYLALLGVSSGVTPQTNPALPALTLSCGIHLLQQSSAGWGGGRAALSSDSPPAQNPTETQPASGKLKFLTGTGTNSESTGGGHGQQIHCSLPLPEMEANPQHTQDLKE